MPINSENINDRNQLDKRLITIPLIVSVIMLILPLVLAPIILGRDSLLYFRWGGVLLLFSLMTLPISKRLAPGLAGSGWLLGKATGLMLVSLSVWTLAYLRLLPFGVLSILLSSLAIGIVFWQKTLRDRKAGRVATVPLLNRKDLPAMIGAEAGFLLLLLVWTFARGLRPEIDGLEKFMDYGFMLTIDRAGHFPAADMWFAGSPINYYYFGQYVFTLISKFAAVPLASGYNLAIASVFAFTGTLTFAVLRLLSSFIPNRTRRSAGLKVLGAGLGGILMTVGGNSHSFFYSNSAPGKGLLRGIQRLGIEVGDLSGFFFSDSTRFIGHNPDINDKTIHEFPYYSFLVADLHAHMINLIFVLLFIGLLILLVKKVVAYPVSSALDKGQASESSRLPDEPILRQILREPSTWLLTLTMAVFMVCNFWDYIIYLVVLIMVMTFVGVVKFRELGGWESIPLFFIQFFSYLIPFMFISTPTLKLVVLALAALLSWLIHRLERSPLTLAGSFSALVFAAAHALTLPFNLFFDPISMSMALTDQRSAFFQLVILWGPHVLVGLIFLVAVILIARIDKKKAFKVKSRFSLTEWLIMREPADVIILLFWLAGLGLIIAPEILYVVDIYGGAYKRANTMFKFTYQSFVLLTLVWGWVAYRLLDRGLSVREIDVPSSNEDSLDDEASDDRITKKASRTRKTGSLIAGIFVTLLAIVPFWYPLSATEHWLDNWSVSNYRGLDGTVQLATKNSAQIPDIESDSPGGQLYHDYQLIQWFNENVEGQPVILEAYGDSYTDYNRISAYTGLPTVLGWQTHEWLWRTSASTPDAYGQIVAPRQLDVRTMYESTNIDLTNQLLDEYQVEYIVVGTLERLQFENINEEMLQSLGHVIFSSGDIYVIRRVPGYSPYR